MLSFHMFATFSHKFDDFSPFIRSFPPVCATFFQRSTLHNILSTSINDDKLSRTKKKPSNLNIETMCAFAVWFISCSHHFEFVSERKLKMVDAHVANRCHCLSIIGWYTYRHTFSQSLSSFCLLLNRWFYYKNKKIHKITHIYTVHDTSGVRARRCVGFNIKFSNLPLALWSASTWTTTRHVCCRSTNHLLKT